MKTKKNGEISQDFTPSLKISLLVEEKIRYMCNKYPTKEWSGVLFYKATGSFERENLTLTTVDLLVLDLGSSTFTEYPNHPEIAYFMAENGYEKFSRGLIHSHNTMATFFSGTDTSTLEKEGLDNVHFLSLIVNNDGKYTAKITKQIKHNIISIPEYSTFGGKVVRGKPVSTVRITVEPVDVEIEYQPKVDKFPNIMDACNRIKEEEEEKKKFKKSGESIVYEAYKKGGLGTIHPYTGKSRIGYCETFEESLYCNNYGGDSRVKTVSSINTPKTSYEEDINLKKVLSLNMGLLPNEARSIEHYVNSLGRFKDVFKKNGEFVEADLRSFIETFVEALAWDEDGEIYAHNVGDIFEGICIIESKDADIEEMLKIFLESVESVLSFAEGYVEIEQDENNIKEEEK